MVAPLRLSTSEYTTRPRCSSDAWGTFGWAVAHTMVPSTTWQDWSETACEKAVATIETPTMKQRNVKF